MCAALRFNVIFGTILLTIASGSVPDLPEFFEEFYELMKRDPIGTFLVYPDRFFDAMDKQDVGCFGRKGYLLFEDFKEFQLNDLVAFVAGKIKQQMHGDTMEEALAGLHEHKQAYEKHLPSMFANFDTNKDGVLDRQEYKCSADEQCPLSKLHTASADGCVGDVSINIEISTDNYNKRNKMHHHHKEIAVDELKKNQKAIELKMLKLGEKFNSHRKAKMEKIGFDGELEENLNQQAKEVELIEGHLQAAA